MSSFTYSSYKAESPTLDSSSLTSASSVDLNFKTNVETGKLAPKNFSYGNVETESLDLSDMKNLKLSDGILNSNQVNFKNSVADSTSQNLVGTINSSFQPSENVSDNGSAFVDVDNSIKHIETEDLEEANNLAETYSNALNTPGVSKIINEINKKNQESGNPILNFVVTAINELGYSEDSQNKNWNRYAEDFKNYTGFYSADKQNVAWCDVFVDWVFVKSFGIERARELTKQFNQRGNGAGVDYSLIYYGFDTGSKPTTGAQIFFRDKTSITHTGIVVSYDSEYVYVIEGNTLPQAGQINPEGLGVYLKKYEVNDPRIAAYGYPKYNDNEKLTLEDENFLHDSIVTLYDSISNSSNEISGNQFQAMHSEDVTIYNDGFVQNTINRFKYSISFLKPILKTFFDDSSRYSR